MLVGFIVYSCLFIVVSIYKSRAEKKREKNKAEEEALKAAGQMSHLNWVAEWLEERKCPFFIQEFDDRKVYFADMDLQKCRAEVQYSLHHPYGNFIASVQIPIIVPKQKFRIINEFIDQHALYQSEYRLLFIEQKAKLLISFGADGSYIMNLSKAERNDELNRLFAFTDDCFVEIGKILFAQRSPELACLKIMGFPKVSLN